MNRAEMGAKLKSRYNCCQAVLLAYEDKLPADKDTLVALGSTFGSGMGGMMGTCGALCGAEMVLGLLGYKGAGMNRCSRELYGRFEEQCGATRCADIKGVVSGRALCSCEDCVRNAINILEEMV